MSGDGLLNRVYSRQRKSDVEVEALRNPKANVIPSIIQHSNSDNYEDARREWALHGIIDSQSPEFTDHCEICNSQLHKRNFLLKNDDGKKEIKVGSVCIKRFLILSGLNSQEETIQAVNNLEREWDDIWKLQCMYSGVIGVFEDGGKPFKRDVYHFHRKLVSVLTDRGQYPLPEGCKPRAVVPLFKSIFHIDKPPSERAINMLFQVLTDTKKIATRQESITYRNMTEREARQFSSRRSKATGSTLSNSNAYKPDVKFK